MESFMKQGNLFGAIPTDLPEECFDALAASSSVRIERIVSRGHRSPPGFWYDQPEHEFVVLMRGTAVLELDGQGERALGPGDWLLIPAHCRHRVVGTVPDEDTVWLTVHYL